MARVSLGHERLEVDWVGRGLSLWDFSGEFGVRLKGRESQYPACLKLVTSTVCSGTGTSMGLASMHTLRELLLHRSSGCAQPREGQKEGASPTPAVAASPRATGRPRLEPETSSDQAGPLPALLPRPRSRGTNAEPRCRLCGAGQRQDPCQATSRGMVTRRG